MFLLDVPYTQQPKKSRQCMAACATMLLRFHQKTADREKIWKKLKVQDMEGGEFIRTYNLANHLKSRKLKTTVIKAKDPLASIESSLSAGLPLILIVRDDVHSDYGHAVVCIGMDEQNIIVHDPNKSANRYIKKDLYLNLCEPIPGRPSEIASRIIILASNDAVIPTEDDTVSCNCSTEIDLTTPLKLYESRGGISKAIDSFICVSCDNNVYL